MLIPIFVTHFIQARFKQVRLSCELNSCIILYFIILSIAQALATHGEIEEVWFGGYRSVPFGPFAWAQPMHATKWARDTGSTSGSWRRSCIQNFYPKTDCDPKVSVRTNFFPLKMVGSHWPTSTASSHLVEPPNGLKQLIMRSQWGFSQAFPLMMIKVILPFIQTKANLKITTCLTPWGPKPLLLTKNQSLRAPQTQYKFHNQIQNKKGGFTLRATPQAQYKGLSSTKKTTSHVLPRDLKLQSKNSFSYLTISQFWTLGVKIWVQCSLSSSRPLSISSFVWL